MPTAALTLAMVMALLLAGCDGVGQRLDAASTAYTQGRYQEAHDTAEALADRKGVRGEQAAYLAGLAAMRLDRPAAARRHLERVARSRDATLAADAQASLGLLHHREGRFREAAEVLERAARQLEGEQRANALFYAGIAHQKLDRWHQARTSLVLARAATHDAALRERIDQQIAVSGYTIQLGAFSEQSNARRAAEAMLGRTSALGFGSPRLVPTTDSQGRAITVVQVGRFSSFDAAREARRQLQATQSIIVPITTE